MVYLLTGDPVGAEDGGETNAGDDGKTHHTLFACRGPA